MLKQLRGVALLIYVLQKQRVPGVDCLYLSMSATNSLLRPCEGWLILYSTRWLLLLAVEKKKLGGGGGGRNDCKHFCSLLDDEQQNKPGKYGLSTPRTWRRLNLVQSLPQYKVH